jgi:hypothetical protein
MLYIIFYDQILEELKKAGLGPSKVFTAKDFEGKSQEDLQKMFEDGGFGRQSEPRNKNKKSKKSEQKKTSSKAHRPDRAAEQDDSEHIEL